jgi:glycosyltransferase involved in cell wall biosynthesis
MNLLITTSGKLNKTPDGRYWTKIIYGYDFYQNYLKVFDEVTVFCQVKKVNEEDIKGMLLVSGPGVNVVELKYTRGFFDFLKKRSVIKKQIKENIGCCDCAVIRPPDQISGYIFKLMKKMNKPVAIEVTTDVWNYLRPGNVDSPVRPLLRLWWTYQQKHFCKNSDGAAYVSNYLRTAYPSRKMIKSNDKDAFDEVFTDVGLVKEYYDYDKTYYSEPIKNVKLIHVAASLKNDGKGYKELIEASSMLRNDFDSVEVTVIGEGDFSPETKAVVNKLDMESSIVRTGKISDRNEIFSYLKNADVFVFPSYSEGLPRTLLEAMANSCVCITSDLPGCREVLDEDVLVPLKDSKSLYLKLVEYLKNTDKMNEQKKKNFEKSIEFSAENVEIKRKGFYEKLYKLCERDV